MRVPSGFPPEILGPWCSPYAGSQRVPCRDFGSMMLSLCRFPAGSLQKFWVHDVVLMRVPSGFPPEILGPGCCPYAGSQRVPSRNFGSVMFSLCGFPAGSLQRFRFHDVVLMRVPSRFPPEILGPWCCPYAGSQRVPFRNFGSMMLSSCGFPTVCPHKFLVHDVLLMRVPNGFIPQVFGSWCCPYSGSQRFPSRNFGSMMLSNTFPHKFWVPWWFHLWWIPSSSFVGFGPYVIDVFGFQQLLVHKITYGFVVVRTAGPYHFPFAGLGMDYPGSSVIQEKFAHCRVCFISQWLRFPGMLLFKTLKSCVPQWCPYTASCNFCCPTPSPGHVELAALVWRWMLKRFTIAVSAACQ